MKNCTLSWELLGAAVGAGLASGREIASFFGRYGAWGYAGITLACAAAAAVADVRFTHTILARLWKGMLSLLLIATGGAMLSGAGETAALSLPVQGARWIGMAVTLVLAWLLSQRTNAGLAWVSRAMLAVLAVLILSGLALPPMQAARLEAPSVPLGLLRALSYGGFNAALMVPVLRCRSELSAPERRCALRRACVLMALLLAAGNAVLQRHPALMAEELPFVRMSAAWGRAGYALAAASLYLAILSTLTACVKGLQGRGAALLAILLTACLGFSGVVDILYPLLGGGCLLIMLGAKFTNCIRNTFNSRRDML